MGKNAFADVFQDARLPTSNGKEIKQTEDGGLISTIMRLLTHKGEDLSSYSVQINETR